jgi:RNA polymerase sigma factor (sigma-70 family)
MESIFRTGYTGDQDDVSLIDRARAGEEAALEALVKRHQEWIYNISLRMVGNPEDARDVTQEILIKIITRLSSFEKRSSFRTWVYRIVVNHVLTMRRRVWERLFFSFERHGDLIERLQDSDPPRPSRNPEEERLLLEETKRGCMTGMLLCLDRRERMALILSTFFDADSALGGELLETSPGNYRQIVSRARKRLGNFMNERCGLLNEDNPCRCVKTSGSAVTAGLVDPSRPRYNLPFIHCIREFVAEKAPVVDSAVEMRLQNLLRDEPMYASPDFKRIIRHVLRRGDIGDIVNFDPGVSQ